MMFKLRNNLTPNEELELDKFRNISVELKEGTKVIVTTEDEYEIDDLFGKYYQHFNIFIERGLLEYKLYSALTEKDFDGSIHILD